VLLTVAENKLMYDDILKPKLVQLHHEFKSESLNDFEPFYNNMKGRERFRISIADYMTKFFVNSSHKDSFKIHAENLICSTGCGCLVNTLAWCLAESGDSCIIPAPYYPAFDNDLNVVSNVVPVPAFLEQTNCGFVLTQSCLDAAYDTSLNQGHRPLMLLLTNPNNPTGTCYSRQELETALTWAREKRMFVISDEIYANSCHTFSSKKHEPFFTSMFDIALSISENNTVGEDVFILYGFSKDFCLSGLRTGILYAENQEFLKAQDNLSYFGSISSDTQSILNGLISDPQWVSDFLSENNKRLSQSCTLLMSLLDSLNIPYLRPTSAMFLVIDLRKFLTGTTWEDEKILFEKLCNECRIVLTPGRDCHFRKPGYFRCCYAYCKPQALRIAFERFEKVFIQKVKY